MPKLEWDKSGERFFETGVNHGVLYPLNASNVYDLGVVWNGLTAVTESPSGAEITDLWADNIKYASMRSAETFGATIEAFTYPEEFALCDGSAAISAGVYIGQQKRKTFGFCYRTELGNDTLEEADDGYKLHIIYNATASPSEKAYNTINDSPDAITFSWEVATTPIEVAGFKPTSHVVIDSTKINSTKLAELEAILYGDASTTARLPLPNEIASIVEGTPAVPTAPTFVAATGILTIPTVVGVEYKVNGVVKTGVQTAIDGGGYVNVKAIPMSGYHFAAGTLTEWIFISTKP